MTPGEKNDAEDSCLKNPGVFTPSVNDCSQNKNFEKSGVNSISPKSEGLDTNNDNNAENPITFNENLEKGVVQNGSEQPCDGTSISDDEKDNFPDGGLKAWSVVVGSFCGSFAVFGILNCSGILLDYFSTHQLQGYATGDVGWIFGVSLFLTFLGGTPVGPIFDAYGPRVLIFCGSILLILSMMLLGLCGEYWQIFIVYSVLNGIGGAMVNTPCISSIAQYFQAKRAFATGIAMTAGSVGGVVIPLMLQRLFPTIGFAWATRILGFILLVLLILTNLLVTSRLPKKPLPSMKSILPYWPAFKEPSFVFLTIAIFLLEWGIFVPLTYITPYVVANGQSTSFGFYIVSILNAGSFVGRLGAGYVADRLGYVNTLIISVAFCVVTCLALWLPAGDSQAIALVFAVLFGLVSGSNLSLSPVCVGQLCGVEKFGTYYSTCWMIVSFGTLTGLPIAGQILTASGGDYTWLIVFAGLSYALAGTFLVAAKVAKLGWSITKKY
ncbi:uncharacterized protein EAE98_006851 [Botrytis deweyae]|uniref:Major facilitator superfamily (MFS) profile domain-containing protein n=1 Tax=Botrytis deweyae TaxID=2478750 RepID=A0ABQ7IIW2_9HELO|nr:uncharacterized protein EAE98_006851 [Botrytis deweyae]KAF7925626.1 hypothetical protein EAE98_006851 [Botrytis deweyae]